MRLMRQLALLLSLLLAALLAASALRAQDVLPVPPLSGRVIDQTGTLSAAQSQAIAVALAWYGQNCKTVNGNVTAALQAACNGRDACQYVVSAATLGDPAPGCAKNYIALYSCGTGAELRLAQVGAEALGRSVTLSCRREPMAPTR